MPRLTWIDDDNLYSAVKSLLNIAYSARAEAEEKFGKNVVDPFSAIFEMSGFGMNYEEWVKSEEARQVQKTLQNFIGEFHQTILGHCTDWENLKKGNIIDLVNTKTKVIAEIKNKHNTKTGGDLVTVYKVLEDFVMPKNSKYKGFTGYYVTIIPKRPKRFNIEFTPSDKAVGAKCTSNKLIRHIDGASFYELVTGEQNALRDLFTALPDVIQDISGIDQLDKDKLVILFNLAYGK